MISFNIVHLVHEALQNYLAAFEWSAEASRDEASDVDRNEDFSVLLTPKLKYVNGGHPMKVPESLSVGTPVILI